MKFTVSAVILIFATVVFFVFYFRQTSPADVKLPEKKVDSRTPANPDKKSNISKGDIPKIPLSLPSGFTVHIFATGLGNPRDLQFSPGGTLLASVPNDGSVYALPDKNNDGVADSKKRIISGAKHPHGLAFYNNKLFVAETTAVVRYSWDETNLEARKEKVLFSLPENNNHNNRTIVFDSEGKMYISVGSTCNVCVENSNLSASVLISDSDGKVPTVFAKGLRNAPFIQFNPKSSELWGTEMGRDNLGDNIPPDEINILRRDNNYGWPNCYGNKIADLQFNSNAECQNTQTPAFEIPAHSAPLGLAFISSSQFEQSWQGDLLVAYHGSWNRTSPTGYKVVHLKVNGDKVTDASDFLTGFIPTSANKGSDAQGRPVDLTFDEVGNLYLSDDKAGNVYIIQKQT